VASSMGGIQAARLSAARQADVGRCWLASGLATTVAGFSLCIRKVRGRSADPQAVASPIDVLKQGAVAVMLCMLPVSAAAMPLEVLQRMEAGEIPLGTAPEIREKSSPRAMKIGRALSDRRAVMFGTYWCPYCDKERQALGKDVFEAEWSPLTFFGKHADPLVRYVECDPRGVDAKPGLCAAAGVSSYPSWGLASQTPGSELPFDIIRGAKGLSGLERLLGLPVGAEPAEPAVAPPITSRSGAAELAVAKALRGGGAKFYGTFWCPACDRQRQLFGLPAFVDVPYVECDARAVGSEPAKCNEAGVESIPFWTFADGTAIEGILSLEELEGHLKDTKPDATARTSNYMPSLTGSESCDDCKLPTSDSTMATS